MLLMRLVRSDQFPIHSLSQTQFCLDRHVWHSDIGKAAAFDDTNLDQQQQQHQATRKRGPRSHARKPKEPPRPLDEWFPGEDRCVPLSNAVNIPSSALQLLWGITTDSNLAKPTSQARRTMKKVHDSMEKLRGCYTDTAAEKASLQVACALLDLANVQTTCENPFVVLQQAAIFAGHGTKRGNSVDLFRKPLPDPGTCLPYEALLILGRADCLQAVYFPYEAAYLCAFVARVCNMHRDSKEPVLAPDLEGAHESKLSSPTECDGETKKSAKAKSTWSNQWMIVGILCYNVSIMIRATSVSKIFGIKSSRTEESYDPWDQDVVDELLLARGDAVAWKSALERGESTFSFNDSNKKCTDDYDEVDSLEGARDG
jgi:hypothetical protein